MLDSQNSERANHLADALPRPAAPAAGGRSEPADFRAASRSGPWTPSSPERPLTALQPQWNSPRRSRAARTRDWRGRVHWLSPRSRASPADPRRRLVDVPPARLINPAFAAAETAWILSGSDSPWIYDYNERLAQFADDGRLMVAYGPRLRRWRGTTDQIAQVLDTLSRDPGSRRAVIQLYDPETDGRGDKDVSCTLGYRFFLRDGSLHMHTTMRSQDLWLGFCYDIFAATVLHELLAGWLAPSLAAMRCRLTPCTCTPLTSPGRRACLPASRQGRRCRRWPRPLRRSTGCWPPSSTANGKPGVVGAGGRDGQLPRPESGDPCTARTLAAVPGPLSAALNRWYSYLDAGRAAREARQ